MIDDAKKLAAAERDVRAAVERAEAAVERAERLLESVSQCADLHGLMPGVLKNIRIIVAAAAKKFGVAERGIYRRERRQPFTFVRQVCMSLAGECLDLPNTLVGRVFRRDHGTVRHARTRVRNRLQTEPAFKRDYESLLAEVSSSLAK